jgi:hypothetical protein
MGRNGVALSETRMVENRAMRWDEHAERMMERLFRKWSPQGGRGGGEIRIRCIGRTTYMVSGK